MLSLGGPNIKKYYLNENSTFQILRRGSSSSRFDIEQTFFYFLIERSAVRSGQGKHLDSVNLFNLGHHQRFRDLQQLDHEIFEAITSGLVHLQIDFRYVGLKSRSCDIMVENQQQYQFFPVWVLCTGWIGSWGGGTSFIA